MPVGVIASIPVQEGKNKEFEAVFWSWQRRC